MDGQFLPVEDYLQIRPEKEALMRRLVKERSFLVGPWYNLADSFLVSGESIVRNLLPGMKDEACGSIWPHQQNWLDVRHLRAQQPNASNIEPGRR